uniref:Uncharacterized protein n=1 Tax=Mastacembelus armatus TaxID=205130 RepID=A0A3Q3RFG6_9TELE
MPIAYIQKCSIFLCFQPLLLFHRLVQQQSHGLRLLWLGHQYCVAAQHHGFVLHLVPVNPSENLGKPRIRDAVGYPVKQVQVSRPPGLVIDMHHPDALRADSQPHLGAVLAHLTFAPDLADRYVCAAVSFRLDGSGIPQVEHSVRGVLTCDLYLFPL